MRARWLLVLLAASVSGEVNAQEVQPGIELGGSLRERVEAVGNPLFGIEDRGDDQVLMHRLMVHADLRLTGAVRLFAEVQDQLATRRGFGRLPTDVDHLDLQQGYVELTDGPVALRAGRQELPLGAGRLSGLRDNANIRRTFDALRATIRLGPTGIDVFAARPVNPRPGIFDDAGDQTTTFWGLYAVSRIASAITLDTYYLGFHRTSSAFVEGTAREQRHSLGVRLAGHRDLFDWDGEAVYQFGTFGQNRIEAWTVATDVGHTWAGGAAPRIGLKANIASGDARRGDGVLGSFNALFPKLNYFSEADIVVPTNIVDVRPEISASPAKALRVTGGFDLIWRQRAGDGYYVTPLRPIAVPDGSGKFIGHQWILEATWKPRRDITLFSSIVVYAPGATLRRIGGRDGSFSMLSATYSF